MNEQERDLVECYTRRIVEVENQRDAACRQRDAYYLEVRKLKEDLAAAQEARDRIYDKTCELYRESVEEVVADRDAVREQLEHSRQRNRTLQAEVSELKADAALDMKNREYCAGEALKEIGELKAELANEKSRSEGLKSFLGKLLPYSNHRGNCVHQGECKCGLLALVEEITGDASYASEFYSQFEDKESEDKPLNEEEQIQALCEANLTEKPGEVEYEVLTGHSGSNTYAAFTNIDVYPKLKEKLTREAVLAGGVWYNSRLKGLPVRARVKPSTSSKAKEIYEQVEAACEGIRAERS
jgi:hypothetical protein